MNPALVAKQYVEVRLLRYVVAIAEETHFGRASKRLHLSPPSLSKQIKDLEASLGYLLFERKTRDVIVTPAGAAFVVEARQALVHVERAVEYGLAASRGDTGTFLVGYSPWFRPTLLLELQEAFRRKLPQRRFELRSTHSATQTEMLLRGHLQAGIVELPINVEGLQTHRVWHDELVAALPVSHRLAGDGEVDRRDLLAEPIIWMARSLHPRLYQYFLESLQQAGYSARIAHEVTTVPEMMDFVAAGSGIGFVKKSSTLFTHDSRVVFRELSGPRLPLDSGVAYRADNRSETLHLFLELLREHNPQRGISTSGGGIEDSAD